jgi:hypothetical protein
VVVELVDRVAHFVLDTVVGYVLLAAHAVDDAGEGLARELVIPL